jgi:hypothetical protein
MRCNDAEPLIGAWQDGELDSWTAWRVARHVRGCLDCAAEAESLNRLSYSLKRAAPLGVPDVVPQAVRRHRHAVPLSAMALVTAAAGVFLVFARSPTPSLIVPENRTTSPHNVVPRPAATPGPAVAAPVPAVVTRNVPRVAARRPEVRRIVVRKKLAHRLRAIRVSRKPSLLPPLTHPEWTGNSIRYIATLTPEEREAEIISVRAELLPAEELRRLVEEKSEFIFVQASLPPALREAGRSPIPFIP